jgi:hypothetical protein
MIYRVINHAIQLRSSTRVSPGGKVLQLTSGLLLDCDQLLQHEKQATRQPKTG